MAINGSKRIVNIALNAIKGHIESFKINNAKAHNPEAAGSSPAPATIKPRKLLFFSSLRGFLSRRGRLHTLKLEFKEGGYRQTYDQFWYTDDGGLDSKNLIFKKKVIASINKDIELSTESLQKSIDKELASDDW